MKGPKKVGHDGPSADSQRSKRDTQANQRHKPEDVKRALREGQKNVKGKG